MNPAEHHNHYLASQMQVRVNDKLDMTDYYVPSSIGTIKILEAFSAIFRQFDKKNLMINPVQMLFKIVKVNLENCVFQKKYTDFADPSDKNIA